MTEPLVSWLTVCQGNYIPLLLATYTSQTHQNKELVIVDGGLSEENKALLIRFGARVISSPAQWGIGDLYNLGVQNARGEYVIIGDEDDWSAPNRIQVQLNATRLAKAEGCYLNSVQLYIRDSSCAYLSARRPWEQTLLARRESFLKCPYVGDRGGDTIAVSRFRKHNKVASIAGWEDLFIYVGTPSSYMGQAHWGVMIRQSKQLSGESAAWVKHLLDVAEARGQAIVQELKLPKQLPLPGVLALDHVG